MAAKEYTYPHVNITTRALQRRTPVVAETTATTLLAPFTCDRGPENELVAIDTMADFISTFGELDYSNPDQRQILNIGRWIAGGGRVLACRITDYAEVKDETTGKYVPVSTSNARKASGKSVKSGYTVTIGARYSGTYYNGLVVAFTLQNNGSYDITISKDNVAIERFRNKRVEDFYTVENASQYIGTIIIEYAGNEVEDFSHDEGHEIGKIILAGGKDAWTAEKPSILFGKQKTAQAEKLAWDTVVLEDALAIHEKVKLGLTDTVTLHNGNKVYINNGELLQYINGSDVHRIKRIGTLDNSGQVPVFTAKALSEFEGYYTTYTDSTAAGWTASQQTGNNVNESVESYNIFSIEYIDIEEITSDDYESIMVGKLREILKQPLETPFDAIIDCGYPISVKKELRSLVTEDYGDYPKRDDAFLFLSDCVIFGNGRRNRSALDLQSGLFAKIGQISDGTNVSIITHYHKVKDIYSAVSGKEVFVPSTYFLAYSIPYYDRVDGPQWPVAGQTRGVINGSLWIDSIPSNKEKQENYDKGLNYIEKDSRGMYIMSQLTNTSQDTALKFINNSRALLKMRKELTLIARRYLHEFNDRITKTNLYNSLNSYLANWIQNRTLSFGSIGLYDYTQNETLTNEELLITLDIKFTGTIEIISFEITVE